MSQVLGDQLFNDRHPPAGHEFSHHAPGCRGEADGFKDGFHQFKINRDRIDEGAVQVEDDTVDIGDF